MIEFDLGDARAVFTDRNGGNSTGPYASRNIGLFSGDDEQLVRRNVAGLCEQLGAPEPQLLRQVHGSQVAAVSGAEREPIAADAAVTEGSARSLLITGADCPPVVLAAAGRLAALHCGWRPVAAGLIEAATQHFAGNDFEAVIGPGICQRHFEVGDEVVAAMGEDGPRFTDGRQMDLRGIIRERLERAGATRVHDVARYTWCEPENFFSYRRDGSSTGRQGVIAWRS